MPKAKNFSSIGDIEREIGDRTRGLYQQASQQMPPMVNPTPQMMMTRVIRRKPQSIIPRVNGKLLFLEDAHNEAVEKIHWTARVDRQDVIRAALQDFLDRYFDGERVTPEAEQKIRDYYTRTHPEY